MSHYQRYPKYKDSGVEWLGDMPEHWGHASIKYLLQTPITDGPHETPDFISDGIEFLSVDGIQNGELIFEGKRFISHSDHARYSKKAKPQRNDVLVGKSASVGKVARVKTDANFNIWSPLAILRSDKTKCSAEFLEYSLKSDSIQTQIHLAGNTSTQANIGMGQLGALVMPLPGIDEQNSICRAVSIETTRIDALIEKKTRFIELLKEKRQALITEAVTKGLDPSVKMKDSGVEWLGEVPEHWKVMALKRLVSCPITDGPHETPQRHNNGVPFVSAEAIKNGVLDFNRIWGYISVEDNVRYSKKYRPKKNDIYMVKSGATTGATAIVNDNVDFNIWSPLAAIRPNSHVLPNFLLAAIRSTFFQDGIALNWSYGTQQNIGMKTLSNLPVFVPPKEEQSMLMQKVGALVEKHDQLINKSQISIELLKERRSALITAAVTGQIDLRDAA